MKTQQERWDEIVQRMKEKVDEGGRGSVSRLAELLNTERGTVSKRMSGIHLAIPVFSKGYRPKQGKVAP